jgi:amidophosphoribosyltransferase
MDTLPGALAIGHVRYSTAGSKGATAIRDVQPFFGEFSMGGAAIAHNGNLTNAAALRRELIERGSIFQSSSDSECIIHLMARSIQKNISERIKDALRRVEGAFSVVAMTRTKLIGVRDALGVRPLVLGRIGDEAGCCRPKPAAGHHRGRVRPRNRPRRDGGDRERQGRKHMPLRTQRPSRASASSNMSISRAPTASWAAARSMRRAARSASNLPAKHPSRPISSARSPTAAPQPPSATARTQASPMRWASSATNIWAGPSSSRPSSIRNMGVRLKLNVNRALIKGKRVILVDDSVVRGTTSRKIKDMILEAGAAEVHFRIASPPTAWPCFYGVDTPERSKLLAANMSEEEMRDWIGVDSLKFITLDGLYRAAGEAQGRNPDAPQYCDACFSGEYPVTPSDKIEEGFQMKAAE